MERLNWQPESLQGTDLDPLHMGCSCGLLVGLLTEEQGLSLTLLPFFGPVLLLGCFVQLWWGEVLGLAVAWCTMAG